MRSLRTPLVALGLALSALAAGAPKLEAPKTTKEDPAIMQIDQMVEKAAVDKTKPTWRTTLKKPEMVTFDPAKSYYVRLQTTKGPMRIKFFPNVAPMHVTSFLYLTKLGFYDDLAFHRVIPGFMAQGGCPLGNGTGNPGYEFGGEFKPDVKHDRGGLLSMANAGPGTDGSQFFLTFVPTPWLDNKHTIFGEVVEGKDTLKAIEALGSQSGKPSEVIKIEKATAEIE